MEEERTEATEKEQLAQSILAKAKELLSQDGEKIGKEDYTYYDVPTPRFERPEAEEIYRLNLEAANGVSRLIISHRDAWQEKKRVGRIRKKEVLIDHPEWTAIQTHAKVAPDRTYVFYLSFGDGKISSLTSYENLWQEEGGYTTPMRWEQREATFDDLKAFDFAMDNLMPAKPLSS